ncbi:YfdX family protein, partial [Mycobacterium tuberculosis]
AEKRRKITDEAQAALNETHNALRALDAGKKNDALSALERASGKLEIILARDPDLSLAPTTVSTVTNDIYGSVDAIKNARKLALSL